MHANLKTENGHLSDEGTALYVDALKLRKLSLLPEWMTDHVSECRPCKERITGLFAILPEDSHSDVKVHPTFGRITPAPAWYRIAAAIALISLAGAAAFLILNGRSTQTTQAVTAPPAQSDSAQSQSPGPVPPALAAALTGDPDMEGLVNAETRSSGVTVLSPHVGAALQGTITFNWKGAGAATVEVYNNRKELQERISPQAPPSVLRRSLAPGLYYWKLTAEDELLFVGKFTIGDSPPVH